MLLVVNGLPPTSRVWKLNAWRSFSDFTKPETIE